MLQPHLCPLPKGGPISSPETTLKLDIPLRFPLAECPTSVKQCPISRQKKPELIGPATKGQGTEVGL